MTNNTNVIADSETNDNKTTATSKLVNNSISQTHLKIDCLHVLEGTEETHEMIRVYSSSNSTPK
ncbi:MAG TPA: hypothetical protein VH796_19045 [Nitrososphaeraceae archaeon]